MRLKPTYSEESYFTVKIRITPQVMGALEQLRDSGFYGDGQGVPSVAEELLREAVRRAMVERVAGAQ